MQNRDGRSPGFSSSEMLRVDNFIFNMCQAAGDSKDLRYQDFFGELLLTISRAVKFRTNSTHRKTLEAKVGRAVLDHILRLPKNDKEAKEKEGAE